MWVCVEALRGLPQALDLASEKGSFIDPLPCRDSWGVRVGSYVVGRSLLAPSSGSGVSFPAFGLMGVRSNAGPTTSHVIDDALVERAKRGDARALDIIARAELPKVERLLLRILGPRIDMEDLVQTVFVEMCRALPGFRGDSAISTFVGGITVRVARRAMRPSAWRRRRAELVEEPVSISAGPERDLMASEQLRRVRLALQNISDKKRIAFLLWALEGLSFEEVAATMGASVSATRSRVFYAQKELKAKAEKDPYLRELLGGGARRDE